MVLKVKILGAGSIGNHLANASRALGWDVYMCDTDLSALARTRDSIYPNRYGKWDNEIKLSHSSEAPRGGFDLILIGTPPDTHIQLAKEALSESPRAILIEKPVATHNLLGCQEYFLESKAAGIQTFVGYDHVVSKSAVFFAEKVKEFRGYPVYIDVEFREHWGGIFLAHPWLSGPSETYLGYTERGGGAAAEHSHGINFWQYVASIAGAGKVKKVQAAINYVNDENLSYDSLISLNLTTENGVTGRCVQDVVTKPSKKMARVQFADGFVEWHCSPKNGCDLVRYSPDGVSFKEVEFSKTRPDDFIVELLHVKYIIESGIERSPISIEYGLDTMLVIAAAHDSHKISQTIEIDYSAGYTPKALVRN